MNQILEVNRSNSSNKSGKKASTKSVILFFCIILLIIGIVMIGLGIISNLNKDNNDLSQDGKISIGISQGIYEIEIDVSAPNQISKIQYRWNDDEVEEATVDGTESLNFSLEVPSGPNTFYIEATDIKGAVTRETHEFVGPEKLNATLSFDEPTNKLNIVCEEESVISSIVYYYDAEEEQTVEVNDTKAEVEIPIKQGEHKLTAKATFNDGTVRAPISNKVYFPIVENVKLVENKTAFKINASDEAGINKVKINFNDQETIEEVNDKTFEKILTLKKGENKLIVTVYSKYGVSENLPDGVSITKRVKWDNN